MCLLQLYEFSQKNENYNIKNKKATDLVVVILIITKTETINDITFLLFYSFR